MLLFNVIINICHDLLHALKMFSDVMSQTPLDIHPLAHCQCVHALCTVVPIFSLPQPDHKIVIPQGGTVGPSYILGRWHFFFISCPLYCFPYSILSSYIFFFCFFGLFHSCCSHVRVFGKTLVHEFHISYHY